jgi:hypothetical protein
MSKVDTIKKKTRATNMTFGINDKAPDVIILIEIGYLSKKKLDLHLRLIRLSVAFSTKTTRYREIMNS